jgi:hypothetical protein
MTLNQFIKIKSRRLAYRLYQWVAGGDGKLERWIAVDVLLMDQWEAASARLNIAEMNRVQKLMRRNYNEFKIRS